AGWPVAVWARGGGARGSPRPCPRGGARGVPPSTRPGARAEAVARHFGAGVAAYDWRERVDRSREGGLIINATSLGMRGGPTLDMPLAQLRDACLVAHLVYVPLETSFLAAARARGLATVDGLGMLLHQAVPGFTRWFGVTPKVTDELRAIIVADIEGR